MKHAALVTGGAKRIGKELALELAKQGYDIALHYHTSAQEAEATADKIRLMGQKCECFHADLTDAKVLAPLVESAFTAFPYLNVLINNASIFERCSFADTTIDRFDRHMALHVRTPFFLSQSFAKQCNNGQIINIIDSHITKNHSPYFVYLLSKKALKDVTEMLALECGPKIRVNAVCPGITEISIDLDPDYVDRIQKNLPLQAVVPIEHITQAVMQCIESEYLTGQCIFVDAGEQLL